MEDTSTKAITGIKTRTRTIDTMAHGAMSATGALGTLWNQLIVEKRRNICLCDSITQEQHENKKLKLQNKQLESQLRKIIDIQKQYKIEQERTQNELSKEMEILKKSFNQRNETIIKLRSLNQSLMTQNEEMNDIIKDLTKDRTKIETKLENKQNQIEILQDDLQSCMETNVSISGENSKLKQNIQQCNTNEIELSKEVEYWRNEYNHCIQNDLNHYMDQASHYQSLCHDMERINTQTKKKLVFSVWNSKCLKKKCAILEWKRFVSFLLTNNEMNQIVDVFSHLKQKKQQQQRSQQSIANGNKNTVTNNDVVENKTTEISDENALNDKMNSISKQLLTNDLKNITNLGVDLSIDFQNISDILTCAQLNPSQQLEFASKLLPVIEQYRKQLTHQIDAKMSANFGTQNLIS